MNKANECTCPSGDGSLRWPCPKHPAVEQAGGDERASKPGLFCRDCGSRLMVRGVCSIYCPNCVKAQVKQEEAERPEVVAWSAERYVAGDHYSKPRLSFEQPFSTDRNIEPLMTVAQHERIVGELRADRDSWAEQAEQRLADWDEMRKERDAALARVAELKAKLAELEKQEPLLHINPLVVDELLGRAKRSPGGLTWSKGRCGSWTLPLYAAPVAQAQHSGWKLVPVEPTEDVLDAIHNGGYVGDDQELRQFYQDILDAAPAPGGE
ncbi:hypothetical protein ACT018_27925 [Pseudomonas aeruginosa]|uniref:hypothetical protein n=1 Tax=Pseudomonas aeruginosa TaxID=287 RepID=UPI00402A25C8